MFKKIKRAMKNHFVRYSYPNWSRISREIAADREMSGCASTMQKNVLLSPTLGIQPSVVTINGYLAMALRARGQNVTILQCDGVLPICQVAVTANYDVESGMPKSTCDKCYKNANKSFLSTGATVLNYGDFVTEGELSEARSIATVIDIESIPEYTYGGVQLGEHAVAGALKYFGRGSLVPGKRSEFVLRKYLESSVITHVIIRKLINKFRFDVAAFHHGIYVPEGVIGATCRADGVSVVNWNPAYRKGSFIFSHTDTYHHTLMEEDVSVWQHLDWSQELQERTIDYLNSRSTGGKDWISFVGTDPMMDLKNLKEDYPTLDYDRPIIGLLTNVIWDAQLHYPANIFDNMIDWIIDTVEYFRNRQDLQLLIRVHPAEVLGEIPSRQRISDELEARFDLDQIENVFLVDANSQLSTYALMELCDSVIIYGTKSGVELTAKGIPVIVAGEAWIKNKGITIDPRSKGEYFKTLDTLPRGETMPAEQQERAMKYAYHFFFRRMIPLTQLTLTGGVPPFKLELKSAQQLTLGNDPGLDVICAGIIDGEPFVYRDEEILRDV